MNFWFELQLLPTFSDYSTLQSKIQSISNGGSINFQYTFGDKNCNSICKSNHVQIGCKYGFRCKVGSTCQSDGNCICDLQMSCNEKSAFGEKFEDNSATNRFHENDENSSATFTGNIENSETYPGNGAQSTPYLGLFKTLIHGAISRKKWKQIKLLITRIGRARRTGNDILNYFFKTCVLG